MTQTLFKTAFLSVSVSLFMVSCSKTNQKAPNAPTSVETSILHRTYGLTPVTADELKNVPVFTPDILKSSYQELGLTYSGTLPSSYLLATPAVRDQGQIGSCTGFCGSEANEIVHYYSYTTVPAPPALTVANGISTAINTKFVSPTSYFGVDGAVAPLFLYYVERVLIEKQKITADNGANMINIGEALQGLSNNTGTGTALTLSGKTYKGECTEDLYPYPVVISGGYNVATSSSTQYKTAPTAAAIANAPNYSIATQSGTTGATGSTVHGYYTIAGSGDNTEVIYAKTAILNNKPVMMGFNVYDNSSYTIFEGLSTTSYIYNPLVAKTKNGTTTYVLNSKLSLLGGHAVPLIGYVDDGTATTSATGGGYFIVQNSWGTPWGYNGDFYLPYSVLRNSSVVGSGNLYVLIP
jgi:papain like protease